MIEVDRVATRIEKENGFRELVFSKNEIVYCKRKTNNSEHYAARFAAKEAFFKAIGTGWIEGLLFNEIEIINDDSGKPELALLNLTKKALESFGIYKIWVTLSHVKTMAKAVVIVEK